MVRSRVSFFLSVFLITLSSALFAPKLAAQETTIGPTAKNKTTFVINTRDMEIELLAEQISKIMGRTLILNPKLRGKVSVVSTSPLTREGAWTLFQSILRARGFVAVSSDGIWQIVPLASARARAGKGDKFAVGSQDVVTRLVRLRRLPSSEAVRILRPLVAQSGYIEALPDPNALIITDTRANVERIIEVVRSFDNDDDVKSEIIDLTFAQAGTVARAIQDVLGPAGTGARISVETGSNLILVRGTKADISEIRRMVGAMDIAPTPSRQLAIRTKVLRLKFGDAEVVAEIVRKTLGEGPAIKNIVAKNLSKSKKGDKANLAPPPETDIPNVSVQASSEINAVIVRGTKTQIAEVQKLIFQLDKRRPQVIIEAAIVEVSEDFAKRLGVQLGFGDAAFQGGLAATSFANSGTPLQAILAALGSPAAALLTSGLSTSVGFGNDFGVLVQALAQSTKANLLSTPRITTLDNRPALIVVGQNVPFRTGSFATDGNTVQPFTTIERRDVGITMEVLPRITSGDVIRLDISQEVSSLVNAAVPGAADLITNRRLIKTTVLADNGSTIVLGGLISDDETEREDKVPILGDIPKIGNLFKSRNRSKNRRTLFVFLKPTILRNTRDATRASRKSIEEVRATRSQRPGKKGKYSGPVRQLRLEINGLY